MPEIQSITFFDFLYLLLKQIAAQHNDPKHCYLAYKKDEFHSAFFEIYQKYSEQFPALRTLHFQTGGAFPYSRELQDAMRSAQNANIFYPEMGTNEIRISWHYESARVIRERKIKMFGYGSKLTRAFESLAKELGEKLKCDI